MIFDQYSRYKACADLLLQVGLTQGTSLLDIGSGPECLFGQFLPDCDVTFVDPLIPSSGQGRISGDIFSPELDGRSFECVSSVDVLEHIPSEHRKRFLARLASLGKTTLILGFPTSDSSDAPLVDETIDRKYSAIFGHEYSWLEEHHRYGLPSLAETVAELEQLGWHCRTIGHGHAPWLLELLGFVICVWDIPGMRQLVQEISEEFNRTLYPHDFRPPVYRQFLVASREPIPDLVPPVSHIDVKAADHAFQSLMEDAWQRYFSASLREMTTQNAQHAEHQHKLYEVSDWAAGLQATVAERDEQISVLNKKMHDLLDWGAGLQAAFAERDEQISALGRRTQELLDWGTGLQAAFSERDNHISVLSQRTQELLDWGTGLQAAITERDSRIAVLEETLAAKQAELMNMSDWAYGMMQELQRRNASLGARCKSLIKRAALFARRQLAQSLVGDLGRRLRDNRRYLKRQVSIESLRQSLKDNHNRLIVVFPVITWEFRWQRPQHIVSRLRDHGYSVFYLAMSLTAQGRRLRGNKDAIAEAHFNELDRHINQIWLSSSRQVNIYTDQLVGDDLYNISLGLSALISELQPKSISYLVQFPGWWPIVNQMQEKFGGSVVFDCMDDHGGFSTNTNLVLETEVALLKNADLVVASSDLLEQRARQFNSHVIQVKNGTEFEHFANPIRNGELDHLSDAPTVGYYGAISDWFDMDLIAYCARKFPNWKFVLIGATFGADLRPVEGLGNVVLLGEKPYKDLPGYLAYFDVCTIPFKIIPLTLATNPVKFYEYLSAGKPVVSVELPELVAYRDDCYLARDYDEFAALLQQAYSERDDDAKIDRRIKLASENSWDSRVRDILGIANF